MAACRLRLLSVAMGFALAAPVGGAYAQEGPSAATVKLLQLMVKKGLLSDSEANELIQEAAAQAQPAASARTGGVELQSGDVRVPYVSQRVRNEIRDEVKAEVLAQAREENWASPNTFPDWVSRITLEGDVRTRYQGNFYDGGNVPALDFNRINQTGPWDIGSPGAGAALPKLNTNRNRSDRFNLRARLGVRAQITDGLTAGLRLGTGESEGPVSTTQLLGGGSSDKNIWLDQAYIDYRFAGAMDGLRLTAGRFANPFYGTDLMFWEDLNLDGFAASYRRALSTSGRAHGFLTLGAFPMQYVGDDEPSGSASKGASDTQWLLGVQAGMDWQLNSANRFKFAVGYFDFRNIRGEPSSACYTNARHCSTDGSRPAFMQKGNTLFALRNNVPTGAGDVSDPQFFGLSHDYRPLNVAAQWDAELFGKLPFSLQAGYVRNLGYDKGQAFRDATGRFYPVNNYEGVDGTTPIGDYANHYKSGPNGYMVKATLGSRDMSRQGNWNVVLGYKYLQPDAVPDAYTDPDFHLGGTNARGYFLGGEYALFNNTWLRLRWMSAKEVYGDPLGIDVLQLDLTARF